MTLPEYELFAIRYATRDAKRSANFLGGDPHDSPMPMDYYVWVARSADRTVVVDTGFTAETARKRGRTYLRDPVQGLQAIGVDPAQVRDVILTHLHYDHVGGFASFPAAQFHLQDDEMQFATGRYMRHARFNHGYDVDDVAGMIRLVYGDRVTFHRQDATLAPGLSMHLISGHTAGMQCVRVHTRRGWVVLASDTSHYYEHFEQGRCFGTIFDVGAALEGYNVLSRLAESSRHIVPGHDPLVMKRYPPASAELAGVVVRLDVEPVTDEGASAKQAGVAAG